MYRIHGLDSRPCPRLISCALSFTICAGLPLNNPHELRVHGNKSISTDLLMMTQ